MHNSPTAASIDTGGWSDPKAGRDLGRLAQFLVLVASVPAAAATADWLWRHLLRRVSLVPGDRRVVAGARAAAAGGRPQGRP
jgi:hypothetical protein